MSIINEATLRDKLAKKLDVLEPNLRLLDKEAYLPHPFGTRSFVDLLAIDSANRYVLIELKRSAESSREAIHEIYKYIEAAKSHLGVREHEVRVLLVSTEWRELIVPFSRFVKDTNISVSGLILKIDDKTNLSCTPIELLPFTHGRYLSLRHGVNLHTDLSSLNRGIEEHEKYCIGKGIKDFVLVTLKAAPGYHKIARQQFIDMYKDTVGPFGGDISDETVNKLADRVGSFDYILYFAMRMLTRDEGLSLITESELRDELEEYCNEHDDDDVDALAYLNEVLYSMDPRPHYDSFQIGYAGKLRTLMLEEYWTVESVKRYGILSRNTALSDEDIIEELRGSDGSTQQIFTRSINISDASQLHSAQEAIRYCLANNPRWLNQTLRILDEIRCELPGVSVDIHIYNPCSGILTLYLLATAGPLYLPAYRIEVADDRNYFGFLNYRPQNISFDDLIKKYYGGDLFRFLFTLTWGGYEENDTDILEDLGLIYSSACLRTGVRGEDLLVYRDERWYKETNRRILNGFGLFCAYKPGVLQEIIDKIGSHWNGAFVIP